MDRKGMRMDEGCYQVIVLDSVLDLPCTAYLHDGVHLLPFVNGYGWFEAVAGYGKFVYFSYCCVYS